MREILLVLLWMVVGIIVISVLFVLLLLLLKLIFAHVSHKARRFLLLVIVSLVVTFVRNFVQYRHFFSQSIGDFLGWWVCNYIAIAFISVVSGMVINKTKTFFFEYKDSGKCLTEEQEVEQAVVCAPLTILMSAIFIFLVVWYIRS